VGGAIIDDRILADLNLNPLDDVGAHRIPK
jgi:hypothetical protein